MMSYPLMGIFLLSGIIRFFQIKSPYLICLIFILLKSHCIKCFFLMNFNIFSNDKDCQQNLVDYNELI
jgi:hypothetical protein